MSHFFSNDQRATSGSIPVSRNGSILMSVEDQKDVRSNESAYQRAILEFSDEIDKGFDNPFYMTGRELCKQEENELMNHFFEDSEKHS